MRDDKGRFTKNIIPWIKGKHHTEETKKKMCGKRPNFVPWNKGKGKGRYVKKIKIYDENKYYINAGYKRKYINGKDILLHHKIWSENNGGIPVPKSCVIHHIDCNKLNNNIDNLVLLPRSFHSEMHWAYKNKIGMNRFKNEVLV